MKWKVFVLIFLVRVVKIKGETKITKDILSHEKDFLSEE
jgi:hypothetical protein